MSFDKPTRNKLANMVGDCRRLLTEDIRYQLQAVYGLQPDGSALPVSSLSHLDERGREVASALRLWQEHLASTEAGTDTQIKKAAFDRLAHETAFTVLNRLAALRMCEERGHVIECVRRGLESDGFALYERFSEGVLGGRGQTYRIFLERMFAELSVELGALFDLDAPQSLVFPRERCLEEVLSLLNKADLAHVWANDETIGWIYQYFNSKEEREAMREASAAPQNGRELAVRNQFFTPRYVVEFLVDNTLGRIWYEMRQGETTLKESCRYLLRRPTEIFLKEGQSPLLSTDRPETPSQDNLLKHPVYIPYRAKRDPRTIRLLDPAVGSGHFLLYAFDLLQNIYQEAWEDKSQPIFDATGKTLREEYADLNTLKIDLPRLILRHNLHGIDIDLRACQIAALALWLRAQQAYEGLGLKRSDRPKITRSNIVCAEPMPGERGLLDQFLSGLQPKVIGQLVQAVFEKMKLAGEAGSLLRIDEQIADAVAEAKQKWLAGPKPEQGLLFADVARPQQKAFDFDFAGITDEAFWEKAEERIYAALQTYAEQAENGTGYQRRLFADDAARGFAFIDLCRKRYDVILMNPPFGKCSKDGSAYFEAKYPDFKSDIGIAFVDRFLRMSNKAGCVGAITSRAFLASDSLHEWRQNKLLGDTPIRCLLDLGYGVLDDAMVEAAAYVVDATPALISARPFIRVLESREKASSVGRFFDSGQAGNDLLFFLHELADFRNVPLAVICYWLPAPLLHKLQQVPTLPTSGGAARHGLVTTDDWRFLRLAWEVGADSMVDGASHCWKLLAKGGEYLPFWDDIHICVDWTGNGQYLKTFLAEKRLKTQGSADWSPWLNHSEFYRLEGLTYPERTTSDFCPRVLPRDVIFSSTGQAIQFSGARDPAFAYLCGAFTRFFKLVVESFVGSGDNAFPGSAAKHYRSGLLNQLPAPLLDGSGEVRHIAEQSIAFAKALFASDETARNFCPIERRISIRETCRSAQHAMLDRAVKVIKSNQTIEELVAKHFGLTTSDMDVIDDIIGPHPGEYPTAEPTESSDIVDLWEKPIAQVVEFCIQEHGPRRQLTKKSFIANRKLELISHGLKAPPETIVRTIESAGSLDPQTLADTAEAELSFCVGCAFGRWDVHYSTGTKPTPDLPDPFAPLPVCPPGQLQGQQFLPITKEEVAGLNTEGRWNYPIEILWDGISVDDSDNANDILRRSREVLTAVWNERSDVIEQEVCEILNVKDLTEYFRKPSLFFADHLRRYSKSRRQAPIYWPLSTTSGSYTLWIYYHRLNADSLYTALNKYVKPKIDDTEKELRRIESELPNATGREASSLRSAFEETGVFLDELREFRDEIARIADLPYKPNLNDGVLITASPLWKLFRLPKWRKDLQECWKMLEAGDYDWAHLAYTIWPDRVREVCKHDRSIAIAHDLESLCELAATPAKKKRSKKIAVEETVPGDEE